jgi:hypothetical protein
MVIRSLRVSPAFAAVVGWEDKYGGDASLWRKHDGSDDAQGTYAHWLRTLRYASTYWNQDGIPPTLEVGVTEPLTRGLLSKEM